MEGGVSLGLQRETFALPDCTTGWSKAISEPGGNRNERCNGVRPTNQLTNEKTKGQN